jgi:bifunctional DNA-binding transcriptional regulator/antitoxin component of YhaV-PrlF toxin-antitoxin module
VENIMAKMENPAMERKIISITGKRQITIPLRFYERLHFGKEVECVLTDDAIVLRPLANLDDGLTMEILQDLVAQGYNGDELLAKFAEQRANINKAINILIDEADEIAAGKRQGATTSEIFGE